MCFNVLAGLDKNDKILKIVEFNLFPPTVHQPKLRPLCVNLLCKTPDDFTRQGLVNCPLLIGFKTDTTTDGV